MTSTLKTFVISAIIAAMPAAYACEPMRGGADSGTYFSAMDANKDGSISKKEFAAYHDKRFAELDANKDGKLSPEELQPTPCPPMHGGGMHGYDDMHGGGMHGGDMYIGNRFDAADTNHDGALTREEAKDMPMLSQYFEQIDANKDGKVTREELHAFMDSGSAMPGKGGMMRDTPKQ